MPTRTRAADHIASLRDSFALHLEATRQPSTTRIYLDALDGLIRYLEANGMPTGVGAIRREHIEAYLGARRPTVKPATLSIEYRALAKSWRWAVEEDEVGVSPMAKMTPPKVPETPVPVLSSDDFRRLLKAAAGTTFLARRDTAILMVFYDTGARLSEVAGMRRGRPGPRSRHARPGRNGPRWFAHTGARRNHGRRCSLWPRPWAGTASNPCAT